MNALFPLLGQWFWWALAGVLLILELALPGIFFIWLAIAAAAVGVVALFFASLGWQLELLLFAAFSLVSVFAGRRLLAGRHAFDSEIPNLNRRMYDFVGSTYPLSEPIIDGRGRMAIDGTLWEIVGPDAPKGARVRVTGVEGLKLTVVPA